MQEKRSCEKTCAPENAREICHEPANASESNGKQKENNNNNNNNNKKEEKREI